MSLKSFSMPLQPIVDGSGNPHPWYMSGSASIDVSGQVRTTTHLERHIALSGFTGGMVACFSNSGGQALFTTPILQYGVDGFAVPAFLGATPSPRDASASFQVDPSIYAQTDTITIFLFHAGKNRLGVDIKTALPTVIQIVGFLISVFGIVAPASVIARATSGSLLNITTPPVFITSGAKFAIHAPTGQYLTAVNGGGMTDPADKIPLHTNATQVGPWEKFKFIPLSGDIFAIRTYNGHYVTAVNGGGMGEAANPNRLPMHTDATHLDPWEVFTLALTSDGYCTMRTADGHYVTAVKGGGVGEPANTLPIHTDANQISNWEKFTLMRQ